ncbi:hypothetical protein [Dyella monticola]|uniref:hypothetical protein n=1 Tax=Dyella monticola TaxID=1927958 RepID=UPI000E1CE81A|nr:hypothetical protein [Dyella monticola]
MCCLPPIETFIIYVRKEAKSTLAARDGNGYIDTHRMRWLCPSSHHEPPLTEEINRFHSMSQSNIVSIVESFTDWSAPWRFLEAVLTHEGLSGTDRIMARNIWTHACSATHWQNHDLQVGCKSADQAIGRAFPWLSSTAREHFVRAASYEWM